MTEIGRKWDERLRAEEGTGCHSRELIEIAVIMSFFSEISMACYTDRNEQIRLLCGSAQTLFSPPQAADGLLTGLKGAVATRRGIEGN